jgi:hypothetical protein
MSEKAIDKLQIILRDLQYLFFRLSTLENYLYTRYELTVITQYVTNPWGFWNIYSSAVTWLLLWPCTGLRSYRMRNGRSIAQAVSRRLPTAAARVQSWVWSCGILWWTKVALGQVFFRELWSVSPANLHSICFSIIIFIITRGWHNRLGVAAVPIVSQTRIKKKKLISCFQLSMRKVAGIHIMNLSKSVGYQQ